MTRPEIEESHPGHDKNSWRTPPGKGTLTDDGERYRLTWWPSSQTTKKALFRVSTDDGVALLRHIRTIRSQQRGQSYCDTDPDATLEDIPTVLRHEMRSRGYRPVQGDDRDG